MRADPDDGYPPRSPGCLPPFVVLGVMALFVIVVAGWLLCSLS